VWQQYLAAEELVRVARRDLADAVPERLERGAVDLVR
jgi:hypothetical protein